LEAAANQKRFNVFAGENATKGYLILNARLTYTTQMFGKNTVWSSGVENMLDKNYWEHLDWGNISRPGRNIYVQGKLDL
jgi:iron complex outermembrane receptor protein